MIGGPEYPVSARALSFSLSLSLSVAFTEFMLEMEFYADVRNPNDSYLNGRMRV